MTKHNSKHNSKHLLLALALAIPVLATGCDSGSDDVGTDDFLEIAGTYEDEFGSSHVINEMTWSTMSPGFADATYHITQWDNDVGYVIAENDADNEFGAGMWSRIDWAYVGETLYYCATAFAAESEQAALDTPRSDDSDPAAGGCGGMFPWTAMN